MVDFQFYLNRQGPRGPQGYKGDKGDDGKTPVPRTGTNTPIETTVIFDTGDGNPYETPNLKYPIEDRGGNMVMLDRANETQYYGTPDQATDNYYGVVKLATPESVLDDPLDSDVVTYELFNNNNQAIKTVTDGLAGDITQLNTDLGTELTNRTNADTQLTNKINTDVGNEATARSNADIALSGRIDNLTTSKADKSDIYTKTQTDSLLNNKSNVGHTHNYNDLTNKPSIGNGTITIVQGGVVKGTFTTNQLSNQTISLESGGGGGGTTYTAGDGIDITNDAISVKYDNSTLKLNGSGQLYADIPTPTTVDQTYNASSTNAQSGVAIAGAGFLTSVPTATTSSLGLVQPDGTTVTINDGVISATGSAPSNMVTTDTQQDIIGEKTFKDSSGRYMSWSSGNLTLYASAHESIYAHAINSTSVYINISKDGHNLTTGMRNTTPVILTKDQEKIYRGSTMSTTPTDFLLEKDMLDGSTIQYNSTSGKVEVISGGGGSTPIRKTITQSSVNISVSSGVVTVTDSDVSTSTLVTLYPSDTTTETWLANNMTSNIINEGSGSFTFNINGSLPSTFSMYYTIQEVS